MAQIQVLDSGTINKIAAGEVIERPASIIKELVENSIDAGASSIIVEIRDGGISYLRVTDNGSGIEADDVRNAFLRHSTSKIRKAEDLSLVTSLGFRGEALASIAAVARVEMITKTQRALTGIHYLIEGGKENLLEEVAAVSGTTIKVEDLFYNTPARRKFLKKAPAEAAAVTELMQNFALGHPEISFQYMRNNVRVLHTPGNYQMKNCIYSVYGKEILGQMLEADYEDGIRVTGYVSRPQLVRANRTYQHFFINGRLVRNRILDKAIEEAYKDLIMPGTFPLAVLALSLDPQLVDVNVHPAKTEVRFSNDGWILEQVYKAITQTLQKDSLEAKVVEAAASSKGDGTEFRTDPQQQEEEKTSAKQAFTEYYTGVQQSLTQEDEPARKPVQEAARSQSAWAQPTAPVQPTQPTPQHIAQSTSQSTERLAAQQNVSAQPVWPQSAQPAAPMQPTVVEDDTTVYRTRNFPDVRTMRIVGQVFATYWLAEEGGILYMIDQHAAHERVMYDRITKQLAVGSLDSQILLDPLPVTLSPADYDSVMSALPEFTRMGFDVEPFGENTVILRCVPYIFNGPMNEDDFREMAAAVTSGSLNSRKDLLLDRMAMMSCKAAIKGDNVYSEQEARALFEALFHTTNPFNCPHGRPTILTMTQTQFEKLFKRIV